MVISPQQRNDMWKEASASTSPSVPHKQALMLLLIKSSACREEGVLDLLVTRPSGRLHHG